MEQGRFSFGDAVVLVPPPAYPPGAALFEHQRALGIGILEPSKAGSTLSTAPPAEHSSLVASTAHRVWPAAYALAMSLHAAHPVIDVRGRAVLELGAGCGLPGLAAWRAGAASVCLTELPENLPRLQQLVHHNGASGTVSVEALTGRSHCPSRSPLADGTSCCRRIVSSGRSSSSRFSPRWRRSSTRRHACCSPLATGSAAAPTLRRSRRGAAGH